MITKDLRQYAISSWSQYKCDISTASCSGGNDSLIEDRTEVYNFDEICKAIYTNNPPASADGIFIPFDKNCVEIIEFKTGFKQIITKDNFGQEGKGVCEKTHELCKDYKELFLKCQHKNIKELISSIRMKAIETYVTLEKQVFPACGDTEGESTSLKLVVIIDGDDIESYEDILSGLSSHDIRDRTDNYFQRIRKALSKYKKQIAFDGTSYYYDEIDVVSATVFAQRLHVLHEEQTVQSQV